MKKYYNIFDTKYDNYYKYLTQNMIIIWKNIITFLTLNMTIIINILTPIITAIINIVTPIMTVIINILTPIMAVIINIWHKTW